MVTVETHPATLSTFACVNMTAVNPFPLETVIDVKDGRTSEPVSLFVGNKRKKPEAVVVDEEIVSKRTMTLEDGLRPLLASMKLFGLYYSPHSEDAGDDPDVKSRRWNAYRVYAVTVVILIWINALRMFSVFTKEDQFGYILLNKLTMVTWLIQCAMSQTAFYAASFSGRLAVVFRQPLDDSCAKHARKFATICSVISWSIIVLGSAFVIYGFFFTDGITDIMITPFQSQIIISNPVIPRVIVCFFIFHIMAAYTFSQLMTFVLAKIFCLQFKKVTQTLGLRLDNQQRNVSDSDIETFRQKHQEISMNVDYIDDALMFSNASAFCCQLFCVIILLYMLIFYHSLMTNAVMITMYVFWTFLLSSGLTLTAVSGIIVHHYVSMLKCVLYTAGHFLPFFIEIRPLSTEISHYAKYVLIDGQQTDRQPDSIPKNITPPPSILAVA